MSSYAIEKLQRIWGKLEFARIERVIAREPEDILSITIYDYKKICHGFWDRQEVGRIEPRRLTNIPDEDRWCTEATWHHYHGFTHDGIYFQKSGCHNLDVDLFYTLDFGLAGNHCDVGWQKPKPGSWIAGLTVMTPEGKKFDQWFVCSPEFLALYTAVMNGKAPSKLDDFARKLVTDDTAWHDTYIAIAALVLYDDVKFFVDMLDHYTKVHPCNNQPFGQKFLIAAKKTTRNRVWWGHLHVPHYDASTYVHSMAYLLEPNWWTTFTEMAKERNLSYNHSSASYCAGCQEAVLT